MGTVTFNGIVNSQAASGETVTIRITKPDGTFTTVTALTNASKAFTATYTDISGNYSAVASIPSSQDADHIYSSATSPVVPFTLGKTNVTRTITLTVS